MKLFDVLVSLFRKPAEPAASDSLGDRGESVAEAFLKKLKYKLLARGSSNKLGELDLVAMDRQTIVFVEVKTRRSSSAGHPAEAVDQRKQAKLTRLALAYLKRHRLLGRSSRFDVIAITWPDDNEAPKIEHIKNAFEASGRNSMYS
jgi:putative endonuclease